MRPDISEFSFGYAITESLIRNSPFPLQAAPLFPSLIQEGRSGGYDVRIPFDGYPLFLQFKLSDYMVRNSAYEAQQNILYPEFFRMHIRPTKYSQQHPMLLDLEAKNNAVYYVAPVFHRTDELNQIYLNNRMIERSLFIKPSEIGRLPDNKSHHISFKQTGPVYLCSKPKKIKEREGEDDFWHQLFQIKKEGGKINDSEESIKNFLDILMSVVEKHRFHIEWFKRPEEFSKLMEMSHLFQIGYITRTILECELFIVQL